jgi:hypothetical protein
MAHELTHVVQQASASPGASSRVTDPADPSEVEARQVARSVAAGPLSPMAATLTGLGVGNAAVVRLLGTGAATGALQRSTTDATTAEAVQAIGSFAGIDDLERLRLIDVVLDQTWVGPSDEMTLERIWGALPEEHLVSFIDAYPGKWDECVGRGAELWDLPQYQRIQQHFSDDVAALARHYLGVNEQLVRQELDALGAADVPPGPEQAARVADLQLTAAALTNLQRAQEAALQAPVGWRVGDGGEVDPDWIGRQVKFRALFKPGEPPPLTEEPADLPSGDIFAHPIVPYAEVQQGYDTASRAITQLVEANPALYGMVRAGSSAQTEAFVTTTDPTAAREKLTAPLRKVLVDIGITRGNLGTDLDPLDLTPLVQQLLAGGAATGGGRWTTGFRQRAANNAAVGHAIERVATRLALQQVQTLAMMLAPFTSGVSLLALLAGAAGAAGYQAYGSYREAAVMGAAEGSSVRPGTELVPTGTAEQARLTAQADVIAFGLAMLALGAEAFAAWRAGAQVRRAAAEERVQLHHGTDQSGLEGLGGGRIDVTHAAGAHQDLGQGFYLTMDSETAGVYAFRRGAQRGGGMQHVLTFEVPMSDLGVVVDVRPGGNFGAQWQAFLEERPALPGGGIVPGLETNRSLLRMAPEQRGTVFDTFLGRTGMQQADTVIAPLGDSVFTGISSPRGTTTQVCIRSQAVADRLNAQMLTGR